MSCCPHKSGFNPKEEGGGGGGGVEIGFLSYFFLRVGGGRRFLRGGSDSHPKRKREKVSWLQ